ncbi:MAG: fibronectin type III domain-containing protein, partial [candidate division Zixibacteria bacterium]|nr:fibronectin type III domain-containing protein [candidate division Zixibacteria bacterium]
QLLAANAGSNSITLTWTAPGDDGDAGTASEYDIRYSTSAITAANWNAATQVAGEPAPQATGSQESFSVGDLDPGTTYYFAMKVADEVPNWSALSNVVSAATDPEQDAPAPVADIEAVNPTSSSVTLTWTASGDDGNVGTASTYDIRYATVAISEANWDAAVQVTGEPSPDAAGIAESFVVSGLSPSTAYYFAIKVSDEVPNWSELSNVAGVGTGPEEDAPEAIADLQAIGFTSTSVTLTWTAPGDDGDIGTANVYDVRYSTSPITEAGWDAATQATGEPAPQAAGAQETFAVGGLQSETTYYFAVKTADEVPNWSALSNVVSAIIPDQTPPDAIANLQASAQ